MPEMVVYQLPEETQKMISQIAFVAQATIADVITYALNLALSDARRDVNLDSSDMGTAFFLCAIGDAQ